MFITGGAFSLVHITLILNMEASSDTENFMTPKKEKLLSLAVPCYNEALALPYFIEEIQKIRPLLPEINIEVVLINDGSKDDTLETMQKICSECSFVRYISFSRNFGKESAILAGLREAKGDWVAVMDADLQAPPHLLPEMLRSVQEEGYDCVGTRRSTRKGEPPIRSFFARAFYKLINRISSIKLVDGARDFKLLSRQAVEALLSLPEVNRFSKGLYEWIGFKTKWIEFENVEKVAGETKWSFWGLFKYSIEGIYTANDVPQFGIRMDLNDMYYSLAEWCATFLFGNYRSIHC